jgi:hypothetical protein
MLGMRHNCVITFKLTFSGGPLLPYVGFAEGALVLYHVVMHAVLCEQMDLKALASKLSKRNTTAGCKFPSLLFVQLHLGDVVHLTDTWHSCKGTISQC